MPYATSADTFSTVRAQRASTNVASRYRYAMGWVMGAWRSDSTSSSRRRVTRLTVERLTCVSSSASVTPAMSRVDTPRTYASVMASSISGRRRAYRPRGAVAEPPLRVRPTRRWTSPEVVSTRRGYVPFRTSTRWSLRSYGPAPMSLSNSSSTTTWMVARTASRHRAVRSCSKSACVGTMRSVASAWRDRFGLFTGGSPWSRNPEIRPSFVVGQPTCFYTTIGTRPREGRARRGAALDHRERNVDVAARGLGIRADLVGRVDQLARGRRIHARDVDAEASAQEVLA